MLAHSDWSHIDRDKIVHLMELANQLPGNTAARELGVVSYSLPFVRKDITPQDVVSMVKEALGQTDDE